MYSVFMHCISYTEVQFYLWSCFQFSLEATKINLTNGITGKQQYISRKLVMGQSTAQGCCLTGAWASEASTIYPQATKILNREPERVPKNYDYHINFKSQNKQQNSLFILHFETTRKRLTVGHGEICPLIEGKHTALCLEICCCDFCCRAVEVSHAFENGIE